MDIEVLDFGQVSLIDSMGSDLTVVNAARVSFDKESKWDVDQEAVDRLINCSYHKEDVQRLGNADVKLIKYLAKHEHWTPFAHPQITLRVKAPISIRTQFFKHKQGFVENEISRRYVSNTPEYYFPKWRSAPTNAKQGSDDWLVYDKEGDAHNIDSDYYYAVSSCITAYERLLKEGVAPEQARFVLPQGCYTEWYWTGSLAAYARYYSQRSKPHAQWEIREYADAISKLIKPLFKVSWSALTVEE
tara:strand:- start:202 stop:936 length:735 start_codon:yes stop_codon:yes gene_type:complete